MLKISLAAGLCACAVSVALAEQFYLLTGVDATHYPGTARSITGDSGPGFPDFYDGDRLAGTSDVGAIVPYYGVAPEDLLFAPNAFGSLSMLYRRGSVAFLSDNPLMGIEFLGGPLLDLDGDPNDPNRSLTPVAETSPAIIPRSDSFIDLDYDADAGTIDLLDFDATGTNEGGPGQGPEVATVLVTIAGTTPTGGKTGPINPAVDDRSGTLTPFTGHSGTLAGVWRIEGLGYELWEDAIAGGSSPGDLGTMQFLGTWRGWLIEVDPNTGGLPTLAGEGLGSTLWPLVDTSQVGATFVTATGVSPVATITDSAGTDDFTLSGNGGLALTDYSGDLGAYIDAVVAPTLSPWHTKVVFLESAGFGINNSFDPIFADTVGYDSVIVAAALDSCWGQATGDSNCDGVVDTYDIDGFVLALGDQAAWTAAYGCNYLCANDTNGDGAVDTYDIDSFVALLAE